MFEKWIEEKQTATDHDIEKDFQISINTLKKWRLADKGPLHFRLGDKILYPRVAFDKPIYILSGGLICPFI
mgnify:CR=1 FL=1